MVVYNYMGKKLTFMAAALAVIVLASVYWTQFTPQPHEPLEVVGDNLGGEVEVTTSTSTSTTEKSREDAMLFLERTSIKGVDVETLSFVASSIVEYYKDKNRVYYVYAGNEATSDVVEGADPATFEIVGTIQMGGGHAGYAKDANHVYTANCGMKACYVVMLPKSNPSDCTKDTLSQCEGQ